MAFQLKLSPDGEKLAQFKAIIYGNAGEGKAQPLEELVLTPDGFKQMKDITLGSYVISEEGSPIEVVGTTEHKSLKMYKVTFKDGSIVECCEDHLWEVQTTKNRFNGKYVVLPLKELLKKVSLEKTTKANYYYKVRVTKPVQYCAKTFTVDPYALGYLLGNGSSGASSLQVTTNVEDTAEILARFPEGYIYKTSEYGTVNQSFITLSYRKAYEALGLYQVKSVDKWIPQEYLLGSIEQRKDLLAGLLDSDGSCFDNKATFTSMSKQLAEQTRDLIKSLGGTCKLGSRDRQKDGKGIEYKLCFRTPFNPFSLQKRANNYTVRWNDVDAINAIASIELVGYKIGKCITVNSPRQLYLTRDYIVTHNSTCLLSLLQTDLPMILFAPEATTIPALQNAMSIYGIEELEEGKLTVVIPDKASYRSLTDMMNVADESGYKKLHEVFFQGKGVDAATGKEVALKKVWEYPEDSIVVYDGWSAVMEAITFKTQAEWEKDGGGKDRRNMYQIGQNYVSKFFNILDSVKAHLIVTAHSQIADAEAQAKFKGLKAINPNFYTKSLAIPICGKYPYVFYAKRDSLSNRFSLSVAETNAFTRDSIDRIRFKEVADEANKMLKQHEKITLSNLPTDLTHEVYNLFNVDGEE